MKEDISSANEKEKELRKFIKGVKTSETIYSTSHSLEVLIESQTELYQANNDLKA